MSDDSTEVRYRLDAEDRITWVNPAWDLFARENGGSGVAAAQVIGRSLWDFIAGEEVRHLHYVLLERARRGVDVRELPFRCDAPDRRRFQSMDLAPLPDGGVEYRCRSRREEPRQAVVLIEGGGGEMRICAWCRRIECGDRWVELEEALTRLALLERTEPPRLSHTICPRDLHFFGL